MKKRKQAFGIVLGIVLCLSAYTSLAQQQTDAQRVAQLQQALLRSQDNTEKANILNELSVIVRLNDPQTAYQYAQKAYVLARRAGDSNVEAQSILNVGASALANGKYANAETSLLRALETYESIYYRSGTLKSLRGLQGSCDMLAEYYRRQKDEGTAKEYKDLAAHYQQQYQARLERGATEDPQRIYTASMEEKPNTAPANTNTLARPNINTPNTTATLPVEIAPTPEEIANLDSLDALANKDRQIALLRKEQLAREQQIQSLSEEKAQREEDLLRQRTQQIGWIAGLMALVLGLLAYIGFTRIKQTQALREQKSKIGSFNEKFYRQEVILREKEDNVHKREEELTRVYAQLDDVKIEKNALAQILNTDIKPQIEALVKVQENVLASEALKKQTLARLERSVHAIVQLNNYNRTKPVPQLATHNLYELATQALSECQELFNERGINPKLQIDPTLTVDCDAHLTRQIFLHLLDNTLKYTPIGGKVVLSAGKIQDGQKSYIKVTIEDNGRAVPSSSLPWMFGNVPPEEARPSGMGLPLVKLFVEIQGGRIEALSRKEDGLIFIFTLPKA